MVEHPKRLTTDPFLAERRVSFLNCIAVFLLPHPAVTVAAPLRLKWSEHLCGNGVSNPVPSPLCWAGIDSQLLPASQFALQEDGLMNLTHIETWHIQAVELKLGRYLEPEDTERTTMESDESVGNSKQKELRELRLLCSTNGGAPNPKVRSNEAILSTVQMILTNLAAPFWGVIADRGSSWEYEEYGDYISLSL